VNARGWTDVGASVDVGRSIQFDRGHSAIAREQGFSGPLNGRETIKYAGHIRQGRNDYQIYTYHGVFRAAVVDHGVSSVIVMLNGSTFFGDYKVSLPTNCKVRAQKVICSVESPSRVIEFTRHGPPQKVWFDGEIDQIELGKRVRLR
jgi:hypothetical protein